MAIDPSHGVEVTSGSTTPTGRDGRTRRGRLFGVPYTLLFVLMLVAANLLLLKQLVRGSKKAETARAARAVRGPVSQIPGSARQVQGAVRSVQVRAGDYLVGADEPAERKPRKVHLEAFEIDRFPVTNREFNEWAANEHQPLLSAPWGPIADSPAVAVPYPLAEAYAKAHGSRLPTEDEWEAAARGSDGPPTPWPPGKAGDVLDLRALAPISVGRHPAAASPLGVQDMAGNVFHWTCTRVDRPAMHNREPERQGVLHVVKAGAFAFMTRWNRASFRSVLGDTTASAFVGFRCVRVKDAGDANLANGCSDTDSPLENFDISEAVRQVLSYELTPGRAVPAPLASHLARLRPGAIVADVGSGIGFLSYKLSRCVGPHGKVFAVDTIDTVLEFVRAYSVAHGISNIQTVRSVTSDISLPPGSCDEVHLFYTVHCLDEATQQPFLESCARAIKPGGTLVVTDNAAAFGPEMQRLCSRALSLLPGMGFTRTEWSLLKGQEGNFVGVWRRNGR